MILIDVQKGLQEIMASSQCYQIEQLSAQMGFNRVETN